jgi:hypothetical protein
MAAGGGTAREDTMKKWIIAGLLIGCVVWVRADSDPNDYEGDAAYWHEQVEEAQQKLQQDQQDESIKEQEAQEEATFQQQEASRQAEEDRETQEMNDIKRRIDCGMNADIGKPCTP